MVPRIDSASLRSLAGRYDNPICRTGPPGYIGWWNRFLGSLKVPKCEILDRSDFHYFYTIKPFWVDDFVVKILHIILIFGGAKPHLFSDA
jgi:hypothetical protein